MAIFLCVLNCPASSSANYSIPHNALDTGGGRAQSATYAVDTSFGSFGGFSSATSPAIVARGGFAGQLNDQPAAVDARFGVSPGSSTAINLSASDVDGDALTFRIISNPANGALTGTPPNLSYTPGPGFTTDDHFTFIANDGISDSAIATVTLLDSSLGNVPPRFDPISNQSINEGQTLSFSLRATDPDAPPQTLAFAFESGAPLAATLDPVSGMFTWTPTEGDGPGIRNVTVRVTDNGSPQLSGIGAFTITVLEVNQSPVLAPIVDFETAELASTTFTATATDADLPAQGLTFGLEPGAPAGAAIDPITGVFSWIPSETQGPGDYAVTIRVTDSGVPASSAIRTVGIRVTEVNTAPQLSPLSSISADGLSPITFTAIATDVDEPAQRLTFSLDPGAPNGAGIDAGTGAFSWLPLPADRTGVRQITVRVTDDGIPNLSAARVVAIALGVEITNSLPILAALPNVTVEEGQEASVTAAATDLDVPPQTLTYRLAPGFPAGAQIDPASGVFRWTPDESQGPAEYAVEIQVSDNGEPPLEDSRIIQIGVLEVNRPPTIAPLDPVHSSGLSSIAFTVAASDPDLPAQRLSFSVDPGAPEGARIDPVTGRFQWIPVGNIGASSRVVTVRVTDDGTPALSSTSNVTIVLDEPNHPPRLDPLPDRSIPAGTTLTIILIATDSDLPPQRLTYQFGPAFPTGATLDNATGVFRWTPSLDAAGTTNEVAILVTDNGQPIMGDARVFRIFVRPPVGLGPRWTSIRRVGSDQIALTLQGAPDECYAIEESTDLIVWAFGRVLKADAFGQLEVLETIHDRDPHRFFRARSRPCE